MVSSNYTLNKIINYPFLLVAILFIAIITHGCAKTRVRNPLPANLEDQVQVAGFENVRVWGDKDSPILDKIAVESIRREIEASGMGSLKKPVAFLALSGGGENGAFGAGVLCGWTATGNRPNFKLVTGISTGALLAPFAFLGPDYDAQLKEVYTTATDSDIYTKQSILTAYWRESVYDTKPLADTIAKYIDEKVLAAVEREYKKGRLLLVGTTQLDAQRLVIWDMGAIASSDDPRALDLFRKVLLASASMPAIFPPVYINVTADGMEFEEMHVDGGTVTEMMLYEEAIKPMVMHVKEVLPLIQNNQELLTYLKHRQRTLYIIRNDQVKPEWDNVKPRLGNIAGRAISTLVKTHGEGDLYRIYVLALRDKLDYNLASIPADFNEPSEGMFDTEYMKKLFNLGYEMARNGYPWQKYPPGYQPLSDSDAKSQAGYSPAD